ncbi:MAG: hypothetical protein RL263_1161 [Bacteroidota bacterium]
MAGTTINDNGLVQQAAINSMFNILSVSISKRDADLVMGIPKNIAFETLCNKAEISADEYTINQLVKYFNDELISLYSNSENISLMPFAMELFQAMHNSNTQIYLNTGFERSVATTIVKTLNLETVIDGYIGSDEVEKGRPNPDMIFKAMQKTNIENALDVMKVGDTVSDLYEGYSAGCRYNIAVLSGAQNFDELSSCPHTHIFENLEPIIDFFKN